MKKIKSILSILLVSILFVGCGSVYDSSKSGYTENTSVAGISFEMPSTYISKATAISSIVNTEDYEGTYVYKNGADEYVFFSMNEMLVICGPTSFDWKNNGENTTTLSSTDILGAWLSIDELEDGFDITSKTSNGIYKIVYNANADYSVTPTNYNTFKGFGATINDGTNEYSIFAGFVSDEIYKSNKDILKHIVKSLKFTGETVTQSTNTEENSSEEVVDDTEALESSGETQASEDTNIVDEDTSDENVIGDSEEVIEDTSEDVDETAEETTDEEKEEDEAEDEEVITSQSSEDDTNTETAQADDESILSDDTADLIEEAYDDVIQIKVSTVYTPLSLGEYGECYTMDKTGAQNLNAVAIIEILNGSDATNLISERNGRKTEPTVGTHFEAAKIKTTANLNNEYLDVKVEGLDGERLVYRGISYTTRAYDLLVLNNNETYETWVYYEVPNGCKEYLLEVGLQAKEVNIETASYKITSTQ